MKTIHDRKKRGTSASRNALPSKRTAPSQSTSIFTPQETHGISIDKMQTATHGNAHACQNENVQ
jgi:hypothetical protein